MRVLLLDIEGTTTPIAFVYDVLFPYARKRMADYLAKSFDDDDRRRLAEEYVGDTAAGKPEWGDPPIAYALWLMDQDRKSRGLKSVQGKIWEEGYRSGAIRGDVYPDVAPAMRRWRLSGRRVFIYSSGSMKAQRLLFSHSVAGDLKELIDGYFDTEAGPKQEAESYRRIAQRIGVRPGECLFVSDIGAELAAAQEAGWHVLLAMRPGNSPQEGSWPAIRSLEEIFDRVDAITERS